MITHEEFLELLKVPYVFVLDTNILFDLYRSPSSVAEDILKIIRTEISHIWLPNQVYKEFTNNYEKIKGEQKKKYITTKENLKSKTNKFKADIQTDLNNYRRYQYLHLDNLETNINEHINEINTIIESYIKANENNNTLCLKDNDEVRLLLMELVVLKQVGAEISFKECLEILSEGKTRYENFIPPGYKDTNKSGKDKYGDLFIWKELIQYSKDKSINIIFVTNDVKEDWWKKDKNDDIVSIRDELKKEFVENNLNNTVELLDLKTFIMYMSQHIESLTTKLYLDMRNFIKYIENENMNFVIQTNIDNFLFNQNFDKYIPIDFDYFEIQMDKLVFSMDGVVSINNGHAVYNLEIVNEVCIDIYKLCDDESSMFDGWLALSISGRITLICDIVNRDIDITTVRLEHNEFNIESAIYETLD